MMRDLKAFAMAAPLLVAVAAEPALAQKSGGILKMFSSDSPASMSIHEEATWVGAKPGFYNLAREVIETSRKRRPQTPDQCDAPHNRRKASMIAALAQTMKSLSAVG